MHDLYEKRRQMNDMHSWKQIVNNYYENVANKKNILDGSGIDIFIDDEEDSTSYVWKLPRSFFPCESDENAVRNLILSIIVRQESDFSKELETMIVRMDFFRTSGVLVEHFAMRSTHDPRKFQCPAFLVID